MDSLILNRLSFSRAKRWLMRKVPGWSKESAFPPGHFYSPLVDIDGFTRHVDAYTDKARAHWEKAGLDLQAHIGLHYEFLESAKLSRTLEQPRYSNQNVYFYQADAFTAAGIIRKFRPNRVVEIGSGFSSAAMLDCCQAVGLNTQFDFIDPFPDRLEAILTNEDRQKHKVHARFVQDMPTSVFATLSKDDILFVDSSHVLKVGSDLEDIFLRILPTLDAGVIVHFHDVFYPTPYPVDWVESGRAWNEALVLQVLLLNSNLFEVIFFNSFFASVARELLCECNPEFLDGIPASIWLRKCR